MIKLSVSDKGFALVRDGEVLVSKAFTGSVKREVILKNLQRGILASKNLVRHEDILIIEVSDSYTYKWLQSESPNPKFIGQFTATHQAINKLICRYMFALNDKPVVNSLDLERNFVPVSNFDM